MFYMCVKHGVIIPVLEVFENKVIE